MLSNKETGMNDTSSTELQDKIEGEYLKRLIENQEKMMEALKCVKWQRRVIKALRAMLIIRKHNIEEAEIEDILYYKGRERDDRNGEVLGL